MAGPAPEILDPTAVRFVELDKEHVPRLLPLEHASYPDPWTHGMFLQEIHNGSSHFYLAYYGETLVAYGGFWLLLDEIHITKVTVAPPYRSRGLGRRLMGFLEQCGWHVANLQMRLIP